MRVAGLNADLSSRAVATPMGSARDESQLLNGGIAIAAEPALLAVLAKSASGRQQNLFELLQQLAITDEVAGGVFPLHIAKHCTGTLKPLEIGCSGC